MGVSHSGGVHTKSAFVLGDKGYNRGQHWVRGTSTGIVLPGQSFGGIIS